MERLGERWLSARVTVERGVVGFGLDYACAHIITLAEISGVNLLPIQAEFVTERDMHVEVEECRWTELLVVLTEVN